MKNKKVPITKRALIQRISRALAKQDEWLRYSRHHRSYMVIDCVGNFLVEHVDLHEKAKELGVLQPWEMFAEGDLSLAEYKHQRDSELRQKDSSVA